MRHDGGTNPQIGWGGAWVTTWWPIPGFDLFVAYTEVNAYLEMRYSLKMDETFMNFKKLAKVLIQNSYINKKTCGSPENTIKRNIPHALENSSTHATDHDKEKGFHQKV